MVVGSKPSILSSRIATAASTATNVDLEGNIVSPMSHRNDNNTPSPKMKSHSHSDAQLSFGERALSADGAAFLSAIIVNPLDVAYPFTDIPTRKPH